MPGSKASPEVGECGTTPKVQMQIIKASPESTNIGFASALMVSLDSPNETSTPPIHPVELDFP